MTRTEIAAEAIIKLLTRPSIRIGDIDIDASNSTKYRTMQDLIESNYASKINRFSYTVGERLEKVRDELMKRVRTSERFNLPREISGKLIDDRIEGALLFGSKVYDLYKSSDYDMFVISEEKIEFPDSPSVIAMSRGELEEGAANSIFVASALLEGKVLFGENIFQNIELKVTKKSLLWYLDYSLGSLDICKRFLRLDDAPDCDKSLVGTICYSSVLSLRTAYFADCVFKRRTPTKNWFPMLAEGFEKGEPIHVAYIIVKNNGKEDEIPMTKRDVLLSWVAFVSKYILEIRGEISG